MVCPGKRGFLNPPDRHAVSSRRAPKFLGLAAGGDLPAHCQCRWSERSVWRMAVGPLDVSPAQSQMVAFRVERDRDLDWLGLAREPLARPGFLEPIQQR